MAGRYTDDDLALVCEKYQPMLLCGNTSSTRQAARKRRGRSNCSRAHLRRALRLSSSMSRQINSHLVSNGIGDSERFHSRRHSSMKSVHALPALSLNRGPINAVGCRLPLLHAVSSDCCRLTRGCSTYGWAPVAGLSASLDQPVTLQPSKERIDRSSPTIDMHEPEGVWSFHSRTPVLRQLRRASRGRGHPGAIAASTIFCVMYHKIP